MHTIADQVIQSFRKYGNFSPDADVLGINYVELKAFNSLVFVKLLAELEEKFNIMFTTQEMKDSKFQTVTGIIEIITCKRSGSR